MVLNSFIPRCHPFSSRIRFLFNLSVMITIILVIYLSSSSSSLLRSHEKNPNLTKYRLRSQDSAAFGFVQFRDPPKVIALCESISIIECLAYLNHNQSDYLQPLSAEDTKLFKENYCTKSKMLYHTFWGNNRHLDHPYIHLFIRSFLYTQNRQCSHMIIWTLPPLDSQINRLFNMLYAPYVEFRSLIDVANDLLEVGTPVRKIFF